MRPISGLIIALLLSFPAYAEEDCPSEYLGQTDVSVIASASKSDEPLLRGEVDAYGQVDAADASQMRSVVPKGAKVVYCPEDDTQHN